MAGLKETKEVIIFTAKLGNAIGKSLADGKITFTDAANFIDPLMKLPAAFAGIENVPAELSDMNEADRQELIQVAKDEFDLDNDKAEILIEDTFELGTLLGQYVNKHFIGN